MKEAKCPSGAILKITPSPFKDAKALYQALLKEMKSLTIESSKEMAQFYKDLFCAGFSSPEIEEALWKCFERCTYNHKGKGDLRLSADMFEPVECREDYVFVCIEVAKENVLPFGKSLLSEFRRASESMTPENRA